MPFTKTRGLWLLREEVLEKINTKTQILKIKIHRSSRKRKIRKDTMKELIVRLGQKIEESGIREQEFKYFKKKEMVRCAEYC